MILTLGPLLAGASLAISPICSPCAGRAISILSSTTCSYFSAAVVVDLLLVAVQHCSTIRVPNRDAIVGAFVAALLLKQERKVSRFISPCSRHISSLRCAGGDPHSLCLGLLDMVYVLLGAEITVTLGEYRKLKQALNKKKTTNHDCINSTRNPCRVTVEGEVTGEIGAGLLVLLVSKRMTTNRKQTVCASVCSAPHL